MRKGAASEMCEFHLPSYVKAALSRLEDGGFSAYAVGGCVRDLLMGRRPHDYDLCTSALPDEIMALFPVSIPSGLKHGTVTVKSGGKRLEVTTFRSDGDYSDGRRPDSVSFLPEVGADLARRDFTMNAIALNLRGELTDPFGGREDISRGLIRCVGNPEKRFSEDALRMFRALRFASTTGFDISGDTLSAIGKLHSLAAALSPERIRDELQKMLLSARLRLVGAVFSAGLMDGFIRERADFPSGCLSRAPKNAACRWSALCALLLKSGSITSAEAFLKALRLDNKTAEAAARGAAGAQASSPQTAFEWKKLALELGDAGALCRAACLDVLHSGGNTAALRRVLESGECRTLGSLAVSGDDLVALGLKGPQIGRILNGLLLRVMETPGDNDRGLLLELARQQSQL